MQFIVSGCSERQGFNSAEKQARYERPARFIVGSPLDEPSRPYSRIAVICGTGPAGDRVPLILRSMRYINARETKVVQTRT